MPANLDPLTMAHMANLGQVGPNNYMDPQALSYMGKYPSVQITYNYGAVQGPAEANQGRVVEDISQNQSSGTATMPQYTSHLPGNGIVPNRRPVPSSNYPGNSTSASTQDAISTETNYILAHSTISISQGALPSYVSHL